MEYFTIFLIKVNALFLNILLIFLKLFNNANKTLLKVKNNLLP